MTTKPGIRTRRNGVKFHDRSYRPMLTQLNITGEVCACGSSHNFRPDEESPLDDYPDDEDEILFKPGMSSKHTHVRTGQVYEVSVNMLSPWEPPLSITPASIRYVRRLTRRPLEALRKESAACRRWPSSDRELPHEVGALFLNHDSSWSGPLPAVVSLASRSDAHPTSSMKVEVGDIYALDLPSKYESIELFDTLSDDKMVIVMRVTSVYDPEKAVLIFPVSSP
jgi:hypothetical protein